MELKIFSLLSCLTLSNIWLYQVNEQNKINGNQTTGLTSGLISGTDWENLYRYYYVNLSRGLEDDNMPKSITVSDYNNNLVAADYLFFVVSKKNFTIDCNTGKIIK